MTNIVFLLTKKSNKKYGKIIVTTIDTNNGLRPKMHSSAFNIEID